MARRTRSAAVLIAILATTFAAETRAAVTGRVMNADGKPLSGVRVRAFAREPIETAWMRIFSDKPERIAAATTETKPDGSFSIDAKGHGVVEVLLDAPGLQFLSFEAVDGEDAGAHILNPAATKRGRITAGGKGVAAATVIVGRWHVTRTNEEGWYETPEPMGPGDRLQVVHPSFAFEDQNVSQRDRSFDVALRRGVEVRGKVVAADGQTPVAGARIRAGQYPLAVTDAEGAFHIANVPASVRTLGARADSRAGVVPIDRRAAVHTIRLTPAATISGTVMSSKGDVPLPGTRVVARVDDSASGFDVASIHNVVADAKGNFTIEGMRGGTYAVTAMHPTHTPDSVRVSVTAGQRVTRGLTVTPQLRIRGLVVDEERKPVGAARIFAMEIGGNAVSGPDGSFELRANRFMPRPVTVQAVKRGYALGIAGPFSTGSAEVKPVTILLPRGFPLEIRLVDAAGQPVPEEPFLIGRYVDPDDRRSRTLLQCADPDPFTCGQTDAAGRRVINIVEGTYDLLVGGRAAVRKELPPQILTPRSSPLTVEVARGVTVEGRLVWGDGSAVESPGRVLLMGGTTTETERDGRFTLRGVTPGRVTLTAEVYAGSVTSEPLDVNAPATGVELRLPRPARIEGTVVERESKQPVREFTVMVFQSGGMRGGRMLATETFRSEEGRFVIEPVAPGKVDVRVSAPSFVRGVAGGVIAEEAKAATVEIALDRGGTITGRVTSGGQRIADAAVMVGANNPNAGTMPVRTDANGSYTIDGVAPGSQTINAAKPGYVEATQTVEVAVGKEARADLELERGRELTGRVIDSTGRPVVRADVFVRGRRGTAPRAFSDAEGNFRIDGLAEAPYTVMVRKEGFAPSSTDVNVGTTSSVTITLERGATIRGRVTGVTDYSRIEVMASNTGASARVDAQGNFSLSGIPDGRTQVRAMQMYPVRRQSAQKDVDVVNGSAPFVEIDMAEGFLVRGRVTRGGRIVTGASLAFMPQMGGQFRAAMSAEVTRDGTYEVRLPVAGEYRVGVHLYGDGASADTGIVNIAGDMTHDVDLRGATLRGRAIDSSSGAPMAGVAVSLTGRNSVPPPRPVTSDSDGRFSIDLLADGEYQIAGRRDQSLSEPKSIVVSNGYVPEVELRMSRGSSIAVRAVDASTGQQIEGNVTLIGRGSNSLPNSSTSRDPSGAIRVTAQPGSYSARVNAPTYATKAVDIVIPGPDLTVALERGAKLIVRGDLNGSVRIVVKDAAGKLVTGLNPANPQNDSIPPGVYTVEGIGPGKDDVRFRRDGVVLRSGETTTVTLP